MFLSPIALLLDWGYFCFVKQCKHIQGYEAGASKMDRGKLIAIVTGVISILIAIAYLVVVQLLDFRGEMIPAPVSQLSVTLEIFC